MPRAGEDRFDKLGATMGAIAGEAAAIVGGNPDGLYIYAEAAQNWVFASVYRDEGEVVRYYDPTMELLDLIQDAWELEDPDKRWAVMECEVRGSKFDAQFKFPEEIDVEEHASTRRPIALKARYGDKPVIYPPLPDWARDAERR